MTSTSLPTRKRQMGEIAEVGAEGRVIGKKSCGGIRRGPNLVFFVCELITRLTRITVRVHYSVRKSSEEG